MYENVFSFESRPFVSAPFVKHYHETQPMAHAVAQSKMCIDRAAGPVVVIGNSGTGKTLLLTMLAEQYADQFNVVNLACARLDQRSDLLQSILFELEQPYRDMSEGELRLALIDYLKPSTQCPNGVLLLVDEAHVLDAGLLDEVRLITNFVRDGQPRVRLVMAGAQGLEDALTNPKLESFNQRIAARCYLSNLSYDETLSYIWTHIDRVGGNGEALVPENTVRVLFEVTDGCPRLINQVCDQALMLAAVNNQSLITEQCLQEAWRDVQNIPGVWVTEEAVSAAPEATQESGDEQWTVLEFGQLDDEPVELLQDEDGAAIEIGSVDEQAPVNQDISPGDEEASPDINVREQQLNELLESALMPPVDLSDEDDEIVDPLEQQIAEFTERYGTAESVAEEDDIVNPLEEQIAEFKQLYGEDFETGDDAANAGEANNSCDDIPIPLEAQLAEISAQGETDIDEVGFIVPEDNDGPSNFADQIVEGQEPLDLSTDNDAMDRTTETDDVEGEQETAADSIDAIDQTPESSDAFENPFDEPFAEEEFLVDQFIPVVAEQNRSSLNITSSELELIRPPQKNITLAELQADLLGEDPITPEAESFVDGMNYEQQPPVQEVELEDVEQLHAEGEPPTVKRQPQLTERNTQETVPFEMLSAQDQQQFDPANIANDLSETNIPDERISISDELDPGDIEQNLIDIATPVESFMAPDFVEKRTEEILQSLSEDEIEALTHEQQSPPDHPKASPAPSYQDVVQAIEGRRNDLKAAQQYSVVQQEDSSDAESILREIQDQNREVNESISVVSHDANQEVPNEDSQPALAIEYPVTEHESYQSEQTAELPADDRDMIIVSRADQLPSPDSEEDTPDHLMPPQASTGRAERMEYQKLFDQLRNLPKDD